MRSQLKKVALGFKLCYIGTLICAICWVALIITTLLGGGVILAGGGLGAVGAIGVIALILDIVLLGGAVVDLVGRFFCLAVPTKAANAKVLVIVSMTLYLLGLGSFFGGNLLPRGAAALSIGGTLVAMLLIPASFIVFLFFLKSFAKFIYRTDLGEVAMQVLWMIVAGTGTFVVGMIIAFAGGAVAAGGGGMGAARGAGCFSFIVWLVGIIIYAVALFRYIGLLRDMSEATTTHARRQVTKKKKPKAPKKKVLFEDEDDEDDRDDDDPDDEDDRDDDRPRRRRYRNEDDRDDDDEDRPRHRRRYRDVDDRDDDDDDQDDDGPRRRRRYRD